MVCRVVKAFSSSHSCAFLLQHCLFVVKFLVCMSYSWGCWTAPPVILLTHADTISVCLSVFSPQEVDCVEQSFVKTISSLYPGLSSIHPPTPLYLLYISSSVLCSLMLSHQTHTDSERPHNF